jgi:hypothetical protein
MKTKSIRMIFILFARKKVITEIFAANPKKGGRPARESILKSRRYLVRGASVQ